jgi:hypothetical protein
VAPNATFNKAVLSALIDRLLGQRRSLVCDRKRRGAAVSHAATTMNTPMKAASLVTASLMGMVVSSQTFDPKRTRP